MSQQSFLFDVWFDPIKSCPFDVEYLSSTFSFLAQQLTTIQNLYIRLRTQCQSYELCNYLTVLGRCYEICSFYIQKFTLQIEFWIILPELPNINSFDHLEKNFTFLTTSCTSPTLSHDMNSIPFQLILPETHDNYAPPHSHDVMTSVEWIPPYSHSILGGTFDHLHEGHKVLLTAACLTSSHTIHVGVSGEPLLTNKQYANVLESYEVREENVRRFLTTISPHTIKNIFLLNDPFGPTITDPQLDALILSKETEKAITSINDKRSIQSLKPLIPIVINYIFDISLLPNFPTLLQTGTLEQYEGEKYRMSSTSRRQKMSL
jgi:phosphopantetheine adenylyltransferase